ncbi:MAG: 3-deoxy-D-manno-oct-2-ulosonic acid (Kdo) hydroxylase [Chthonomonadales bacterium]|nr:3-deoxy-D-manno-oct-2-ulosonic acid (Kdo) hydroxylase [Chthonomonadales bacterium]
MELIQVDLNKNDVEYSTWLCRRLEQGNILLLPTTPFLPTEEDCAFLRSQKQTDQSSHKNIAYKPHLQKVTGADTTDAANAEKMRTILAHYSEGALSYLSQLFPAYASQWRVDYASFRPVEEQGRKLAVRHRNDLMHLDAFPTRPTHGGRILRAFTNIHPTRERVWGTADPFEDLARQYAVDAGLNKVASPMAALWRRAQLAGRLVGLRVPNRSAYDDFMLRFHHYLKTNEEFQRSGQRQTAAFPSGSTWISFTDLIAHKALSGQYAMEQTCIVPYQAMLEPELAPVSVLQRIAGRPLVSPDALKALTPDEAGRVPA